MLSESTVNNLEEAQELKHNQDIVNKLIHDNHVLKNKYENLHTKTRQCSSKNGIKGERIGKWNGKSLCNNEYLIGQLLKVDSLESKLALVCYILLLKST